ncbi:MAG: DUF1015 family protein [Bacteroidota bacterium]
MPLSLQPFPAFYHPPFGVVDELPYCRDGVRNLPATTLVRYDRTSFAELRIHRHVNGAPSRGICGLLPATAFADGTVRPHEATLESRLLRQEKLVLADRGALGKPILLTVPRLTDWWEARDQDHMATGRNVDFVGQDNDYQLRSYERSEEALTRPLSLAELGTLCIADGHHRAATHARLAARGVPECRLVPVCIIGAEELHIGTFLRVIDTTEREGNLLDSLAVHFKLREMETPLAPVRPGRWLLVHAGRYYRLERRESGEKAVDNRWLENVVLPAIFGIHNTRTDERITYEPVADTPGGRVDFAWSPERTYLCGFPLPKEAFFAEVAAGRLLPPKSTRFEPRVPSGMVVWMP